MCGIVGAFAYNTDASLVEVEEVLLVRERMISRGPDDCGLWASPDQRIVLGHRRLSVIDLSERGRQPMCAYDERYQLVFNGEIYNFKKLRKELIERGCSFTTETDTEVLLHLYHLDGLAMLGQLRGMFALAIWDQDEKELILARDPFGMKPLYYSDTGKEFWFASQCRALKSVSALNTELDAAGAVGFFLYGSVPEPYTLYSGIRQLPAGATLRIKYGQTGSPEMYCDIGEEFFSTQDSVQLESKSALIELKHRLLDSLKDHLIADVPTGFFLSAGLDSTLLTTLATELEIGEVHTVTLGFSEFRGTELDETIWAEKTAQACGSSHQTKWVTRSEFQDALPGFLETMDQPTIDGLNTYFVSQVAREAGLTVAISGLGADEIFGGYPSFKQIPSTVSFCSKFSWLAPAGAAVRYLSRPLLRLAGLSSKYASLLEYGASYEGAYLLRRGLFLPWELGEVLDEETVRLGLEELEEFIFEDSFLNSIDSAHLKVSNLEMRRYMRNQLLRDSDWASMAHSLEIRLPFVDLPLLNFILALSKNGQVLKKDDLARSLSNKLPADLIKRKKSGFCVPLENWLASEISLKQGDNPWRAWARRVFQSYQDG